MKRSRIFSTDAYKEMESDLIKLINEQSDFLSIRTAPSTRAVGDAIQAIISENFQLLFRDSVREYTAELSRRAMADFKFTDADNFAYHVDVKTHRLETEFNMPNLTSVRRLASLYEDDNNYFVILSVSYALEETRVHVDRIHFVPIEFLSWDCLTVGALGWGQIQIANANIIHINDGYSRKKWMLKLCDVMLDFYPKEIRKIDDRINHFRRVKEEWEER